MEQLLVHPQLSDNISYDFQEEAVSVLMKSPLLSVVVMALFLSACTRKQESSVRLSLDLAGLQASRKAQSKSFATYKSLAALALPPSTSIGVIVINVTGPGINSPILSQWNAHHGGAASTPPSQIVIEGIPKGDGRLVQALVVYDSTAGSAGGFYYDEVAKSFVEDSERVDLALKEAGTAGVGDDQISGRYLTSATAGPTGKLSVYFQVPNHRPIFYGADVQFTNHGLALLGELASPALVQISRLRFRSWKYQRGGECIDAGVGRLQFVKRPWFGRYARLYECS